MSKNPYHLSCLVKYFDSRAPSGPFYLELRIRLCNIVEIVDISNPVNTYFVAASRACLHRNGGL